MILARLLVLSTIVARSFAQIGDGFESPLIAARPAVLLGAQLSQDAYGEGLGSNGATERFTSWSSSVLFASTTVDIGPVCIFAFAGLEMGFGWVADMKFQGTYIKSGMSSNKRRRCRVLKSSKQMFKQTGSYMDEIDALITGTCSTSQVLFAGHDMGGSLATMFAVYYEQMSSVWAVTFGAPPTFVPPQYSGLTESSGHLRTRLGRKPGCRYMNFDQYIPIINTEQMSATNGGLVYDFMAYLNFVLYSMLNDATFAASITQDCLTDAAMSLEMFDGRGNAGHPWGQYALLPPTTQTEAEFKNILHYPQPVVKDRGFSVAMPTGLTTDMMDIPASCDDVSGSIHDIAAYVAKIEVMGLIPENAQGFTNLVACNFDFECRGSSLFRTGSVSTCGTVEPGLCVDPDARGARPDDDDF